MTKETEFFEEALALGDMIKNKMAEVLSGVNQLAASRGGTQNSALPQSEDHDMQAMAYTPRSCSAIDVMVNANICNFTSSIHNRSIHEHAMKNASRFPTSFTS